MAIPVKPNKNSSLGKPSVPTVHGGNHSMYGKSGAVPQKPEAMVTHGSGGGNWARGGGGYMCKFTGAKAAKAC